MELFCYNFVQARRTARMHMISLFGKEEKKEPSLLDRLKQSVGKTRTALSATVDDIFRGERRIDPSLLKQLETALIAADLGSSQKPRRARRDRQRGWRDPPTEAARG